MKTIKTGNRDILKAYKYFECSVCGWIGKAEKDEYTVQQYYNTTYYEVKCPICFKTAKEIVDSNKLKQVKALEKKNEEFELDGYAQFYS